MKIFFDLDSSPRLLSDTALSIGTFDGIHSGHQSVLCELRKKASHAVVITFSNHPRSLLYPDNAPKGITTIDHKCRLFEEAGIGTLFLLPFTEELSRLSAEDFIKMVREKIPFSHLVLGPDATFGANKSGNRESAEKLGERFGFSVDYLNPVKLDNAIISSGLIRKHIADGSLSKVSEYLGRNYSIMSKVIPGEGRGTSIGFPTANLDLSGLCLPPLGVYGITAKLQHNTFHGVANLGHAPTFRNDPEPLLEAHLFGEVHDIYGEEMEVHFGKYIRSEQKFNSVDELKAQIAMDINSLNPLE